jgi:hypothetical protein
LDYVKPIGPVLGFSYPVFRVVDLGPGSFSTLVGLLVARIDDILAFVRDDELSGRARAEFYYSFRWAGCLLFESCSRVADLPALLDDADIVVLDFRWDMDACFDEFFRVGDGILS